MRNIGPYIARLAPLLPQLVLAYRRRAEEPPQALREAGLLGQRHVGVLVTLAISGPLSVSGLAAHMDMTVAHASLVVGELAKAGLVERDHDERDRRRIIVSLSDTARPAVAEMRGHFAAPMARFLGELGDDEAEAFIANLALLLAHLREESPGRGSTGATRRPDGACREPGGPAT